MPIKINDRTLIEALWGEDSYALLFVLLLIDYVMMSLVNSARWGGLLRTVPVVLTVLFAMHTSHAHRHVLRVAQVAAAFAIVAGMVQAFVPYTTQVGDASDTARGVSYLVMAALLLVTPVAMLRRILRKERVDIETLFAAVDVYIIIGLIFSALFTGLAYVHTHPPFLAQPPSSPHQPSDYVYLSFVTLTTVGFGDLTPLTDLARSVVVFEALIGQIFLVTLVARLVSLYSRENQPGRYLTREPRHRGTDDDDDTGRHHRLGHRGRAPDDLVADPDAPDLERDDPDAPDAPNAPDRNRDAPADGSPRHEGPGADRG
jgi:voltage-gated potassium channel